MNITDVRVRKVEKEGKMKVAKEDKEKENLSKSNKLYISTMNHRLRYLRGENANEYRRTIKLENLNNRMKLIDEKKEKQNEEKEEIKRLQEEINKDKLVMMNRLQTILTSDNEYTKDEVNNYVFKGIRPHKKTKEDKSQESNDNDNDNENKGNGSKAFITGLK